jgi:hypothetical protein
MSCSDLARRFTESYYSSATFNSSGNLNEYLNSNGILLTMCIGNTLFPKFFGGPCKLGFRENHVSASWIRKKETGFRVFGPREDVGLILDPFATSIQCLYPVDGVTDSRSMNGCGPTHDAIGGSNNFWRAVEKYQIESYKNQKFGKDTKWMDIDCNDMLETFLGPFPSGGAFALNNTDCLKTVAGGIPFIFESPIKYTYDVWSDVLGHAVCNATKPWPEPSFNDEYGLLYFGSCAWVKSDWVGMVDTMIHLSSVYPKLEFWNEVVVTKPKSMADIVQAVFVMDGSYEYKAAKWVAEDLGRPLIVFTLSEDGNLSFLCDEVDEIQ